MKIYKYLFMLFLATIISCDDILETEPIDELTEEAALSTLEGVNGAVISVYDQLQNVEMYGRDLIVIPELLSDNMRIALQNTNRLTTVAINQERAHIANWNTSYSAINRLNIALANIDAVSEASNAEKNRVKGQALFLRALIYHNLVKTYARDPLFTYGVDLGVPIRTEPFDGLGEDDFPARSTITEVYTLIKSDLTTAIGLLNNEDQPFFASQVAAKALLARVYLYEGSWQQAADMATEVINDAGFGLSTDYQAIFSADAEALFSVKFVQGESLGPNNALQAFFIESGDAVLRQDMINAFETGDERADLTFSEVQGPETVTKTLKYDGYQGSRIDNIPVLRLSEMFLTRAEANVENNSSIGDSPLNDINAIRDRAGLGDLTSVDIATVVHERRVELAFEGHRFFDLKRKGMDIPKGVPGTDCFSECTIDNDDYRVVAAISQVELDTNDNLVQNPNYN